VRGEAFWGPSETMAKAETILAEITGGAPHREPNRFDEDWVTWDALWPHYDLMRRTRNLETRGIRWEVLAERRRAIDEAERRLAFVLENYL
jgi:hypothetical protein